MTVVGRNSEDSADYWAVAAHRDGQLLVIGREDGRYLAAVSGQDEVIEAHTWPYFVSKVRALIERPIPENLKH